MALTYVLISSTVLSTATSTVTFSSIPQTYTDLVIRASLRNDQGDAFGGAYVKPMSANGLYSWTRLFGVGTAGTSSNRTSSANDWTLVSGESINAASSTANTFSSHEFYFPSYTTSQQKVASLFNATEREANIAYLSSYAALVRNTSAITSIDIGTGSFVAGSSFYLYGIKNS